VENSVVCVRSRSS